MPTVQNIIRDARNQFVSGAIVTIELVLASDNSSPQAFVDITGTSDFTINIPGTATTDPNGTWTATLQGNASITNPSGTRYKITETAAGISRTYRILVPDTGGPYWVGNILG